MARSAEYYKERSNRVAGFELHPRRGVRVNPGFDAKEDTPLDKINALLADQPKPRRLHPTKGFRKLNARRERAAFVVADILNGGHWPLDRTRRFVVEGY